MLCDHIRIAEVTTLSVKKCLKDPKINDSKTGFEYYAAVESECNCIVTEIQEILLFKDRSAELSDFYMKHMTA